MRESGQDAKTPRVGTASGRRLGALAALLLPACAGAGGDGQQAVATQDVRVLDAGGGAAAGEGAQGYDYVARRALGVVALAEARGIDPAVARAAVDRLADALDACVTEQGREGPPVEGAARIVARVESDGTVSAANLRVDPGAGTAATAALCLIAPLRQLSFGAADAGARGLAIEALWGHLPGQR